MGRLPDPDQSKREVTEMNVSEETETFELERIKGLPGTAPRTHPDIAPFWESLQKGKLSLQRCNSCSVIRFPLSPGCHECLSDEFSWEPIDPHGKVNVAMEAHQAVADLASSGLSLTEPWRSLAPFISGNVDMNVGVRLPGRILCHCGKALVPGTEVKAVLLDAEHETTVYGFAHECDKKTEQ